MTDYVFSKGPSIQILLSTLPETFVIKFLLWTQTESQPICHHYPN